MSIFSTFFERNTYDEVSEELKTKHMTESPPPETSATGRDRLLKMFAKDEYNSVSRELTPTLQAGVGAMTLGAFIGGFLYSRIAYIQFMEENQATAYENINVAKTKLQYKVTMGFGKGAFRWGWRLGLFASSYVFISTAVAVYRGKSSVLEYTLAGFITGACYKMNLGLRGMAVGGLLGSVLGTFAGGLSVAVLKMTGTTIEDVLDLQYNIRTRRLQKFVDAVKEGKKNHETPLLIAHGLKENLDKSLKVIPDEKKT